MGWRCCAAGSLALVLFLSGGPWARAADQKPLAAPDSLQQQLEALNRLTGTAPLQGQLRQLQQLPDKGKALIAYAWEKLKKGAPLSYNAAYVLAQTAQQAGDLEASIAFYRECGRQALKLESTDRLVQSFGGLIDLLYDHKRYEEAARVCQEILEMKAPVERPRIALVSVTNRLGEADFEEVDDYNSAALLRPAVHRLLIQIIAKQGKYQQALKLVDNLLQRQDDWQTRALKGEVLREAGKYAEAAQIYEEVLERVRQSKELTPARRDQLEDNTRYILSNIYVDLNQIDKAAEQLQLLIKKHPDEPGYQNDLGYIWADHDMNLAEAEKLIRRALDLDRQRRLKDPQGDPGENGAYLDSLGWVLFKQKKYKEARQIIERALQDKAAQHIEIYDHLGDICLALGDREAAIRAWRRGLEVAGPSRREQLRRAEVERKLQQALGAAHK